jgi:hypothetical protein
MERPCVLYITDEGDGMEIGKTDNGGVSSHNSMEILSNYNPIGSFELDGNVFLPNGKIDRSVVLLF